MPESRLSKQNPVSQGKAFLDPSSPSQLVLVAGDNQVNPDVLERIKGFFQPACTALCGYKM